MRGFAILSAVLGLAACSSSNAPPSLLSNGVSGPNHWLKVLLVGVESNRSAIGAIVVAIYGDRRQAQAVLAQTSYLSVNDRRLHFGLGAETKARV